MKPEATFDVLAIVSRLENALGPILPSEIHLFGYLACLLSLYAGRPVADWEYTFAGTNEGSPYSRSLDEAIQTLCGSGDLSKLSSSLRVASGESAAVAPGFRATPGGRQEYEALRTLSQFEARDRFLSGACASALTMPLGLVRTAMSNEPALKRVSAIGSARALLEKADCSALYEQFGVLSSAIEFHVEEYMVPAVAWLTYLVTVERAMGASSLDELESTSG